jgi:hypothetical protein
VRGGEGCGEEEVGGWVLVVRRVVMGERRGGEDREGGVRDGGKRVGVSGPINSLQRALHFSVLVAKSTGTSVGKASKQSSHAVAAVIQSSAVQSPLGIVGTDLLQYFNRF